MKRFILYLLNIIFLLFPVCSFCLEILSNESLDKITGQAVTDNPALLFPELNQSIDLTLTGSTDTGGLTSYSQGNTGINKTVAIEFIGKDRIDANGNHYRESFNSSATISDVMYQNTNNSYVLFEGSLKGWVVVPEYFDDNPLVKSKELYISNQRINLPDKLKGTYICSYQGHIFSHDDITTSDQKFSIYPNIQTITVGKADNDKDLAILVPHGTGENTVWEPVIKNSNQTTSEVEYLVVPKGGSYIQVALNQMTMKTEMKVKIRLGHTSTPWIRTDDNPLPPDMGQTLGTATLTGGEMKVSGGNIIITTNNSL